MSTRWLVADYVYDEIAYADTVSRNAVCRPSTFVLSNPKSAPAISATVVARYRSLVQFKIDLDARVIDKAYRWVIYDPEKWPDTPAEEQDDPALAMRHFGQLAHASGYRVIMAPARDLAYAPNSVYPKLSGEDASAWYLANRIAMAAARYADVLDIQAQYLTVPDLVAYKDFVHTAVSQAYAANRYCRPLAGISTNHGTAAEMAAAAKSVNVGGYWLNVPGPNPDFAKVCEFLRMMEER
jgi:hypothetical protein